MSKGAVVYSDKLNETHIVLRYPTRDDVCDLLNFINTTSKERTYIMLQGEQLTLDNEKKYIEDYLKKIKEGRAVKLLAFHKKELIGVADVYLKDKVEQHIGVFGIIVIPEWRGKGVGKLLMKLTIEEAEKNIKGLECITLGVFGNNAVAAHIYKHMGFIQYGVLPRGIMHKGTLVDHIYMYKFVNKKN